MTTTYYCVVPTAVTDIQMCLIRTLSVIITLTFNRAVSRGPTKVTFAYFWADTAAMNTSFRTDWQTNSGKRSAIGELLY